MSNASALSFLSAVNPDYLSDLYDRYSKDPASIDSSWADLFGSLGEDAQLAIAELKGASWTPSADKLAAVLSSAANAEDAKPAGKKEDKKAAAPAVADPKLALDSFKAAMLIRAYRTLGHLACDLDPLGLMPRKTHADLDPATYGLSLDREVITDGSLGFDKATVGQIVDKLKQIYCGTLGIEYMYIDDPQQRQWLQERIEKNPRNFTKEDKKRFLQELTETEGFERFLDVKYTGTKRFGVEGGDAVIPAVEEIILRGAELGLRELAIGMAHRGRLNMLTNVLGKSFTSMFAEFQGTPAKPDDVQGSGDVKYHLGVSSDRDFNGHMMHLSLATNPSHLEVVNPVVIGKIRAKQAILKDTDKTAAMPLIIHGDAAVAGQGVVPEVLMMSQLPGYGVGGTMNIVINNQIGFTTMPRFSRSGTYCTDVAKMIQAPVLHVNGDDTEAVIHAARIAIEYRQKFKRDVFLDIICYRRHGHNESDEPAFTQPQMYKVIKAKKTVRDIYAAQLVAEGVMSQEETDQMYKDYNARLETEFKAATSYKPNRADMLEGQWTGLKLASGEERRGETALDKDVIQKIGKAITTIPEGFDLNSKIARQLDAKKKMFETGEGFDWATAEALAFGSLVLEGSPVRLSGQDCGRGTFSQRHAALTDQTNEQKYYPLNNIDPKQAAFEVHDSPLSEEAVLGFEYGFSTADPRALVLWEGQFGDFVNGAQVIIDQFIASAETKWLRMSGIVMLLPHGSEGQGPEHSSARPERFLQMCAEDNWQVVNCSTPANYFHALRRQIRRDFRKPLIIMTPKSLLRHKLCTSKIEMFTGKETFHRVLADDLQLPVKDVKRVIICSGKVYYDLFEAREKRGINNVALLRLEQYYPFPDKVLAEELKKYPDAEIIWCQEEPENQGAWLFVDRRIEKVMQSIQHKSVRPRYVGRVEAAAPATGSLKTHNAEQEKLINEALTV